GHDFIVKLNVSYSSRMKSLEQFYSAVSEKDKDSHNLDAPTCRTCTGSNEHNYNKYHFRRLRPEIKICCCKSCTCYYCNHMKDCIPERIRKLCAEVPPEQEGKKSTCCKDQDGIEPEFIIFKKEIFVYIDCPIVKGKVCPGNECKKCYYVL